MGNSPSGKPLAHGIWHQSWSHGRPWIWFAGILCALVVCVSCRPDDDSGMDDPTSLDAAADRQRELQVVEVALTDYIDPTNPEQPPRGKSERRPSQVLLDVRSIAVVKQVVAEGTTLKITEDLNLEQQPLNDHVDGKRGQHVSLELGEDLRQRNASEILTFEGFTPKNSNIIIRNIKSEFGAMRDPLARERLLRERYPQAWGYVKPYRPGFARDGQTAVVVFHVGPSQHGETWTYLLSRSTRGWQVKWRHRHVWKPAGSP